MKTQRQPRPTVKAILDEHVTLSVECLDRLLARIGTLDLRLGCRSKRFQDFSHMVTEGEEKVVVAIMSATGKPCNRETPFAEELSHYCMIVDREN
ncbi:MAG TPA: hypothetical protein P5186_00005 [Candidatus Paceibacterota bacterium]|nr:hypothetical protein [Candidatus Paceibacterota bacterium]HSA02266.1 hypothetical protein [Candidatus Paceibacterota bacterium]